MCLLWAHWCKFINAALLNLIFKPWEVQTSTSISAPTQFCLCNSLCQALHFGGEFAVWCLIQTTGLLRISHPVDLLATALLSDVRELCSRLTIPHVLHCEHIALFHSPTWTPVRTQLLLLVNRLALVFQPSWFSTFDKL